MRLRYLTILILLAWCTPSVAQEGSTNPFELAEPSTVLPAETATPVPLNQNNPFEIQTNSKKANTPITQRSPQQDRPPAKNDAPLGFKMVIAFSSMFLLGLLMTFFRGVFGDFWDAAFRDRKFNQMYRKISAIWVLPHIFLFIYAIFSIGLFIYLALSHFGSMPHLHSYQWITTIALGYGAYFIVKHLFLFFIGDTFDIGNETSRYSLLLMTFNIVAGICVTPINLLLILGPASIKAIVVYLGIILCGGLLLLLLLRAISVANRFITKDLLHFFVYLCALEIAPIAIVAKLLS